MTRTQATNEVAVLGGPWDRACAHAEESWAAVAREQGWFANDGTAARLAIRRFGEALHGQRATSPDRVRELLASAIHSANDAVYRAAPLDPRFPDERAAVSFAAVWRQSPWLCTVHSGDARVYAFREDLVQLTDDHRIPLPPEVPPDHPMRFLVTQLLGVTPLEPTIGLFDDVPGTRCLVTTSSVHLRLSRRALVDLCSQGAGAWDILERARRGPSQMPASVDSLAIATLEA